MSIDQVVLTLVALCDEVRTPRALAVKLLARAGEWAQLQELRVRPSDYTDPEALFGDNLVTDFLRKCKVPSGVDTRARAVRTFWECETQNCRTNVRLSRFLPETPLLEELDGGVAHFIDEWRKEVKSVLGGLPLHLTPRFSRGATYADTGSLTTIPDKMSSTPTLYGGMVDLLRYYAETAWYRSRIDRPYCRYVRGNIFFTVPKDGKTDRGCCKEASLAVSLQLDVGACIRSRLRRIGIDLINAQPLHRCLAQNASVDGEAATIDLSNASDTMCRNLVKLVLPDEWHELLSSLRARFTRVDGSWIRLEKFSSMGNGFTFELETLLFVTLARCVTRRLDPLLVQKVRCYGDDLIVPTGAAQALMSALNFFGFTPNESKSFIAGRFRESCGGDFMDGIPVRGFYLKELPDEPQHWMAVANGLRRVSRIARASPLRARIVRRAWLVCLRQIPWVIRRCRGPEVLGDVVLHDEPSRWRHVAGPKVRRTSTVDTLTGPFTGQLWIRAYVPVPTVLQWHHWRATVQLASCTLGLRSAGVTPRGGISGYRVTRLPLLGITTQ